MGEIWKTPVAGGTPVRIFQPFFPKAGSGSAVAIVGSNLIFNDQDNAVGEDPGMKKLPLAGGAATRISQTYATLFLTADSTSVYFATENAVCRVTIP